MLHEVRSALFCALTSRERSLNKGVRGSRMKKYLARMIGLLAALVICLALSYSCWITATIRTEIRKNLEYSEQIDYLLKVLVYRIERGDDVYTDLKWLSANYNISYESQNFPYLMRVLVERDTPEHRLQYVQEGTEVEIRIYPPEAIHKSFWCLQGQSGDLAGGSGNTHNR